MRDMTQIIVKLVWRIISWRAFSISIISRGIIISLRGVQPVPWKMRLKMLVGMQIEILNGGEILVNCTFKWNPNLDLNLYREIQKFKFNQNLNSNLYRETPRNLSFSILTSWLKSPHHSGFRFAFWRAFRVSSSRERAVSVLLLRGLSIKAHFLEGIFLK